jgi:hypothetical protein
MINLSSKFSRVSQFLRDFEFGRASPPTSCPLSPPRAQHPHRARNKCRNSAPTWSPRHTRKTGPEDRPTTRARTQNSKLTQWEAANVPAIGDRNASHAKSGPEANFAQGAPASFGSDRKDRIREIRQLERHAADDLYGSRKDLRLQQGTDAAAQTSRGKYSADGYECPDCSCPSGATQLLRRFAGHGGTRLGGSWRCRRRQ